MFYIPWSKHQSQQFLRVGTVTEFDSFTSDWQQSQTDEDEHYKNVKPLPEPLEETGIDRLRQRCYCNTQISMASRCHQMIRLPRTAPLRSADIRPRCT